MLAWRVAAAPAARLLRPPPPLPLLWRRNSVRWLAHGGRPEAPPAPTARRIQPTPTPIRTQPGLPYRFGPLHITAGLHAALSGMDVHAPTEVQQLALEPLCDGTDAIVHAATGTGKTLAIVLVALMRRHVRDAAAWRPFETIIVQPTRELVMQTAEMFRRLLEADLASAPRSRTDSPLDLVHAWVGGPALQEQVRCAPSAERRPVRRIGMAAR